MTAAIRISGLEKTYSNGMRALKGIDLEVREGDFFALLGPNGAGKSTTIGILSSLVNKSVGEVSIFGHSIDCAQGSQGKGGAVSQALGLVGKTRCALAHAVRRHEAPIDDRPCAYS